MRKFLVSKLCIPFVAPIVAATICTGTLSVNAQQPGQPQPGQPQPGQPQPNRPQPGQPQPGQPQPNRPQPNREQQDQGQQLYNPIPLPNSNEVSGTLTDKDIPTGFGGFYRDYVVTFEAGDQVVMDLTSEEFDTIISLIAPDGSTVSENDDGPDGTTNSLLFARVTQPGSYIIRVSPYAGQGLGSFNLKVTRLRPV